MNGVVKLLLLVLALLASTAYAETLYTYRQVGFCNGEVINEWANPTNKPLIKCLLVPSSVLELAVFPETQRVVVIEEDISKKHEELLISSSRSLNHCSVVDQSNFTCDGLVRVSGKFTNTYAINWRIISQSYAFKLYSSLSNYSTAEDREFLDNSIVTWIGIVLKWIGFVLLGMIAMGCLAIMFDKSR